MSPRCTNSTLGQDGHMRLQCRVYGTERYPMGVPSVPMVHWDGMDTWVAVQGIWDREISHGSPRCTNGTLGRDGHMGLQCRVYGTERHPMLSPRCTNGTLGRDGRGTAVQGIWDRETSHGSPRCTNGTLGWDGHMGLQCRP